MTTFPLVLASYATALSFADISSAAVARARHCVIDILSAATYGAHLAAASMDAREHLYERLRRMDAAPVHTVPEATA